MISVGNLKKVKNHIYALREILMTRNLDITLDIYGSGNLFQELTSFIKDNNLKVRILTAEKITTALLCDYDFFLLPSLSEGMPVSLIEAIVSGVPSLISNLPQLRETAGNSALYFSPHEKGSLADLLIDVSKRKDQLISLSEATKKIAGKYSWEYSYNAIEGVYQRLLTL
jgi:glycosyltransferase involved in cell wall biosynthesis